MQQKYTSNEQVFETEDQFFSTLGVPDNLDISEEAETSVLHAMPPIRSNLQSDRLQAVTDTSKKQIQSSLSAHEYSSSQSSQSAHEYSSSQSSQSAHEYSSSEPKHLSHDLPNQHLPSCSPPSQTNQQQQLLKCSTCHLYQSKCNTGLLSRYGSFRQRCQEAFTDHQRKLCILYATYEYLYLLSGISRLILILM